MHHAVGSWPSSSLQTTQRLAYSPAPHRPRAQTLPPCRRLAGSGGGDVFMTDDVLSTLMCAPRSTYPWVSALLCGFWQGSRA